MKNNRKEIDVFLIELNKFFLENIEILSEDNIFDFMIPFKAGVPSSFGPKDSIPLSSIIPYINKSSKNSLKNTRRRGSNYLRRVAYKVEYTPVIASSYWEIFYKILLDKGNLDVDARGLKLTDFYRDNPGKELIIPKDYGQINFDMYFCGKYKIIK